MSYPSCMGSLPMGLARLPLGLVSALSAFTFASSAALAEPPPVGSFQREMMQPYVDFITHMRNCCNLADGRAEMKEVPVLSAGDNGTDPDAIVYRVRVSKEDYASGSFNHLFADGKGEVWAEVPRKAVITAEEAEAKCKPIRAANELARAANPNIAAHSCNAPSFNILWLGQWGTQGAPPRVLCYWPRPQQI